MSDTLLGLFKVKEWSPQGSNSREPEEAVIFNWENYVRETAGKNIGYFCSVWPTEPELYFNFLHAQEADRYMMPALMW